MTDFKFISFFKGLKSENLINFYNKGDSTAILLETSVVCDGRPKSGVRRKNFQQKQFFMFLNQPLSFLFLLAPVSGLPTFDIIYNLSLSSW